MVDVGNVNGDSDSVESKLKNYSSLIDGLEGNWKGTSHDSIVSKAEAFANEFSSKVSSQMDSFGNAVAYYKEYEDTKELLTTYESKYDKAVKDKNATDKNKYSKECEICKKRLDELKAKIEDCLNAIIGAIKIPVTVSNSSVSSGNGNKWSNYKDAVADGATTIMTEDEFSKRKTEYSNYQEYLNAMYDKYITNGYSNLEYQPKIKKGNIDTKVSTNNGIFVWDTVKYDGEYIEFENKDGYKVNAPLAIAKVENGKIVYTPMTEEQKEKYINRVTHYYNDIMDNTEDYTDKFKSETGDRVDTLTFVYADPATREEINDAKSAAAYCRSPGRCSNHSDVVLFSDQFIDLSDDSNYYNTDEAYDYMLDTYTHELGHAYANDRSVVWDRDNTYVWNQIYDTVSSDPTNAEILRDYSLSDQKELFADATEYYYTDPDRLKQVEIDFEMPEFNMKFDTLYDYMDYIMN